MDKSRLHSQKRQWLPAQKSWQIMIVIQQLFIADTLPIQNTSKAKQPLHSTDWCN